MTETNMEHHKDRAVLVGLSAFRLEREGRALVFTPTSTEGFHRTERDVDKIKALWKDGWDQGLARLDEAEAFLKGD